MPISHQKTEILARNKVLWQNNMLPGGGVDWVIVGFSAPVSVEKKAEAEIDIDKDFEHVKAPGDLITTTIPMNLKDVVRKNVISLIVEGGSKRLAAEAFKIQEAAATKFVTNEIEVLKKANFEYEVVEMSAGSLNKSYLGFEEAIIESANGAKQMLLKHSRNGSFKDSSLTAAEILQSSNRSSQATSEKHPSLSITSQMESGGPGLRTHNVPESIDKPQRLAPIRPCNKHLPCITLPNSPPSEKQHPAEILKSWSSSNADTMNDYTHTTKARLATSVSPMTKRFPTTRPKTSASVASRMIKRDLGL
ncbi:hypothetical protein EYC80_010915 [Monilinia laxa]|uniref:Uncharacterized protein n=1 Tax=Monilinia laxa TaxID=61186 RepID=A0A5N6JR70_MONLA|nr:hypothetical protein EYC80_010915 [Monilinia laxa]